MKAICTKNNGNDFDPKVGEIVEVKDLHITRIWRNGDAVDTSDENNPGYHMPSDILLSMLREGDVIENNYCHGRYRIVADECDVDYL